MKKESIIKIIILAVVVLIVVGIFTYKIMSKSKTEDNQTAENKLESEVSIYYNEKSLPTLLDFGSTTCEPCKTMFPILNSIEEKYQEKLVVKFINVYSDSKNTKKYNIRIIPTQIFLNSDGKVLYRHEGVLYEDEIIEKLNELGVK